MVKSALFITAGYCPVCHRVAREAIEPVIEAGYDIRIVDGMQEPGIARQYHVEHVPVLVLLETPESGAEPNAAIIADAGLMTEDLLYDFFDSGEDLMDFCMDRLEPGTRPETAI